MQHTECHLRKKRGLEFLVVEDDSTIRKIMCLQLKIFGLKVDHAQNGVEAVRCVENRRYDMIFMDIQMPEMNGIDATAWIRNHEVSNGHAPVPIVATTAGGATKQQCLDAGMNGYIEKPVDIHKLIDAFQTHLFLSMFQSCVKQMDDIN
ncbi:MAG: response regulator [Cyanobacteria bacterium SZAS-4]|nr:response regulator [Cyanobacteria bacterium SZAS-4]